MVLCVVVCVVLDEDGPVQKVSGMVFDEDWCACCGALCMDDGVVLIWYNEECGVFV